jgi:bifunctional enzyme CysN/CysC/sulfate adenylyltransferase subunit 1
MHRSNRIASRRVSSGWVTRNLAVGERYKLKLTTQELDAEVVSVEKIIDASTLESASEGRNYIARNDVAEVTIQTVARS